MTEPAFDANGWATIDSAPANGDWIFLHVPGHGPTRARYRLRMGWESHSTGREITKATHWRPLPKPPVGT